MTHTRHQKYEILTAAVKEKSHDITPELQQQQRSKVFLLYDLFYKIQMCILVNNGFIFKQQNDCPEMMS